MRIDIMTLFPEAVRASLDVSILGRASKKGVLEINCVQIRDYTENRQGQVDDYPYGGGFGQVMYAQPLKSCLDSIMSTASGRKSRVIYLSPQGAPFTQETAKRLCRDYDHLVLVCGHYEGVDERFIELCVDEEISLGDFVLTGGEIAAMAVTDAVCRLVPGVLRDEECYTGESHWDGLLEFPQYTRPDIWENLEVPEALRRGNHAEVARWRRKKSLERTMARRPDMFSKLELTDREDIKILKELEEERAPKKRVFDCRRAQPSDIGTIMGFVTDAQAYLKSQGVDQWQYGYPTPEHFLRDMEEDGCWLFFCDGEPAGAAAILTRPEEAYRAIEGKWLTEGENYCAVHRACISSAFRGSGLSREMFSLAEELARGLGKSSVRVDTHRENLPMQGVLRKCGYAYCGVIHIIGSNEDGAERLAFEKIV